MTDHALAALFVLACWWAATGAVLRLVWLPSWTFRFSVTGMSIVALASGYAVVVESEVATPAAAYVSFACALGIWGWHELTFLLGMVTGPRKAPCPAEARGGDRFRFATAAVIHHELALALTFAAMLALTWGRPNQVASSTFAVLWIMRLSAKLNLFLGVRNVTEEFVPNHLRYLLSYFRRARLNNPLMPVSLIAATAMVAYLASDALSPDRTPFELVSGTLVTTLLALAVLEHIFLAVPLPDARLWRWLIRTKSERALTELRP